jgi:peroxiredoxin
LCDHQTEFAKLNARILIISFGTLPAIQQWLSETCPDFTVLLDRDRAVYQAYQLERSRLRSWHPRVVWLYIKRWFQRGDFYDSHGDDTSQLGGDFIVDKSGVLRFIHPSHDPTDRPSVEKLLGVLKQIQP